MEFSEALTQNLFGFAAALIGGIAGGVFTLQATNRAIREENDKERRNEEKEVQNLLDALGVEIGTLWGFHMRRVGGMVENLKPGEALEFYYPLTQDYFSVYNTNAARIGSIKDAALREAIVVCYNKCKKIVDGYKYNNELYRDWRDFADANIDPHHPRALSKYKTLQDYALVIKDDHFEAKAYVERLLDLLKNRSS